MEDFRDILAPGAVTAALSVPNKRALFQHVAGVAGRLLALDPRAVADCLADRERLGSTGFGGGVAIPHGKVQGLDAVAGFVVRLQQPIDFQAIDGLPVDLVFLLLSPVNRGVDHLKALARVSRALRDRTLVAKLRGAGSDDALYALLTDSPSQDAA